MNPETLDQDEAIVRAINLPPAARGRVALGLTSAAAEGRFALQVCAECQSVQYPPREACHRCLSPRLPWCTQGGGGMLLGETTLRHSNAPYFGARLPWRVGLVQLDAGPSVFVHLHAGAGPAPARVRVGARLDRAGVAVLIGFPTGAEASMADDKLMREMGSDPRACKVLVTDGTSALGRALVAALVAAGADTVWAGHAGAWHAAPEALDAPGAGDAGDEPDEPDEPDARDARDALAAVVRRMPLDLNDGASVQALGGSLGPVVDVVINNAESHAPGTDTAGGRADAARADMELNYFGLLRLAQSFAPLLRQRAACAAAGVPAWVNVLSIHALFSVPGERAYAASKAAALSLSQGLRAELQPSGVRVLQVFPGPIVDPSGAPGRGPAMTPAALATAIVRALCAGVEDVYPGELAQELHARWRDDPKVLERELAASTTGAV